MDGCKALYISRHEAKPRKRNRCDWMNPMGYHGIGANILGNKNSKIMRERFLLIYSLSDLYIHEDNSKVARATGL